MLKVLDGMVEVAVKREESRKKPLPSSLTAIGRTTPDNLCGFEIPAEMVHADRIVRDRADRLSRITHYRRDANRLRDRLAAAGVEPIAIITAKAFDALIAEMGLFTLRPTESGTVEINNRAILALRAPTTLAFALQLGFLLACAVGFIWAFCLWGWAANSGEGFFGAAVLWGMAMGCVTCFAELVAQRVARWRFARRSQAWLASKSWEDVLVALSNNRSFHCPNFENEMYRATQPQIVLPPAPADVIEKVCRIAAYNVNRHANTSAEPLVLHIAAEAGAIAFKNGLAGLFDLAAIDAQLAYEERLRRDPILFVRGTEHGAVAIIAQYGDLPLERATIKKIVNSEHLL